MVTQTEVWERLGQLEDGMFGSPLSVLDIGLINDVQVDGTHVRVQVTQCNRGRVDGNSLASAVRRTLGELPGVGEVVVECVWDPPWTPDRLSARARSVLRFAPDDPPEGRLHVRAERRADPGAAPLNERRLPRAPALPADRWQPVEGLPADRFARWRGGWRFARPFVLAETAGLPRHREPVHLECQFEATQVRDPAREVRLVEAETGIERPCQVCGVERQAGLVRGTLVFFADLGARQRRRYLVLHGNDSPSCWPPSRRTDLVTRGEGYGLEVENDHYRARLSPVMGQLRNLEYRRWGRTCLGREEPLAYNVTDAANDPHAGLDIAWHGEDSCIHWNPDFSDQLRFRITNWPEPPHWAVSRGDLCTVVERWGYPVCPLYPALPQEAVRIRVTYVFYAGLPYFRMRSRLDVDEAVDIRVVRNDEWVFWDAFTHAVAMPEGGQVTTLADGHTFSENPALWGLYHQDTGDALASLNMEYDARGFPGAYDPARRGIGTMHQVKLWARWAFASDDGATTIQPGATIGEHNVYLLYNTREPGGHAQARDLYRRLREPLSVAVEG